MSGGASRCRVPTSRQPRWCVHWIDNHWPREVSWLAGPLWLRSAYRFTHLVHALWVLALLYTSLSLLLSVFPLTRAWGEALNQYLLDLLFRFGDAGGFSCVHW